MFELLIFSDIILKAVEIIFDEETGDIICGEEGGYYEALVFYVVVEDVDGKRLRHFRSFEDEAEAEALRQAIVLKDKIDQKYWSEIAPAYGSDYHAKVGDRFLFDSDDIEAQRTAA